jgi:pyruvate dehydrogenase (quinone)
VSLYTQTISSAEQAPLVVRQAIAAAYAGPGVAHLTLPQDILSAKAVGTTASLAILQPHAEISPDESCIAEVVERIDAAQSVVILCGAGCRGAAGLLRALSDRLKAPLVHTVRGKEIMSYDPPALRLS